VGWRDVYKGSTKLVLVPPSDSYLLIESISVGVSGPSCPTLHHLLTTLTTDYCLKNAINNFGLRKLFYSRQDFKNTCHSLI